MERLHPFFFLRAQILMILCIIFLLSSYFFQILVMAKGEVVECGTHKELVAAGTISPQIYQIFLDLNIFQTFFSIS